MNGMDAMTRKLIRDREFKQRYYDMGLCPLCKEHRPLYNRTKCYDCYIRHKDDWRGRNYKYPKPIRDDSKYSRIESYIRGICVKGNWPKSVYFGVMNKFRTPGTRYDNVLKLLEQGFSTDVIVNSFEGMDDKTLNVFRKILTGRISGVSR